MFDYPPPNFEKAATQGWTMIARAIICPEDRLGKYAYFHTILLDTNWMNLEYKENYIKSGSNNDVFILQNKKYINSYSYLFKESKYILKFHESTTIPIIYF